MIRGYCMGGGLLTAMQADIRIAAEDSLFAIPAARLGVGYGFGGVQPLVALVGAGWAAEILFSARRLSAAESTADRSDQPGGSCETSSTPPPCSWPTTIAENAPLTVAACKVAITQTRLAPERRQMGHLAEMVEACFRSEDYREGQRAFAEKRTPRFTGH